MSVEIEEEVVEKIVPFTGPPAVVEPKCPPDIILLESGFGLLVCPHTGKEKVVRSFTWHNRNRISVQVINFGATIVKFRVPNRIGIPEDIVLGYDDLQGYLDCNNPYFGATLGRFSGRIYRGTFKLNEQIYNVTKNLLFKHHINGGRQGFDKVLWDATVNDKKVTMTYLSKDEDEGFPGNVLVTITFELLPSNEFIVNIKATSTKPTPINVTISPFFNLAGHAGGVEELEKHVVMINADSYLLTNPENIPTGQIHGVQNKIMDLQIPKVIGSILHNIPGDGFDHTYCVNRGQNQGVNFLARVVHPPTGRVLEVYSNQPGLQFYTGNFLPEFKPGTEPPFKEGEPTFEQCCKPGEFPCSKLGFDCNSGLPCEPRDPNQPCCTMGEFPCHKLGFDCHGGMPCVAATDKAPCCEAGQYPCSKLGFDCTNGEPCAGTCVEADLRSGPIRGKNATYYHKHGAFTLLPQNYPDAINHDNFPSCILNPGQTYLNTIIFKFWLMKYSDARTI